MSPNFLHLFSRTHIQSAMANFKISDFLIVCAALFVAFLFGLIATTGHILLIALAGGLVFGLYAFANPAHTLWGILGVGLFIVGLVPIWAAGMATKAVWAVSMLGLILFASVMLKTIFDREQSNTTPACIWLALFFILYCFINGAIQSTLYELITGIKRYFQVISICFAFAWLGFSKQQVFTWKKLIVVLVIVQLPFVLYELFKLVPMREGIKYAYPGLVPIDVVAGTFGASKTGGGANAEMATFLIMMLGFLLAYLREKIIDKTKFFYLLPFVLLPLFLGETKIVIVFLPLLFCTLYRKELLNNPLFAVSAFVVGSILTLAATLTYVQLVGAHSIEQMVRETLEYNVGSIGYGGFSLNRMTALTFWFTEQGAHDPVSFFFGNGIGAAHDVTGGSIARVYVGYGVGLTALSSLLWEQGLMGAGLFYSIILSAWVCAGRIQIQAKQAYLRADAAAIQAGLSLFAFYPIYRKAMLENLPFQILFWALLGLLAWVYRESRKNTNSL